MKLRVLIVVVLLAAFGIAYGAQQQLQESDRYRPTSSIQDIMDSMIDPSADDLWDSVSTSIGPNGVISTKVPRTEEEWMRVRQRAITLIESSNLLLIPGRRVAKPGAKSQNPGIELSPEQIEQLIAENPTTWIDLSRGMQDAATQILGAIEAKNVTKLSDLGGALDHACESCHLKFWYPNEAKQRSPDPRR